MILDIAGDIHVKIAGKINFGSAPVVIVTTTIGGIAIKSKGGTMAYQLPSGMQVQVGVQYQDANGNPAQVDGQVTWETSDANILDVVPVSPTPDGYPPNGVVAIAADGPLGTVQVVAKVDADLGSGARELVTLLTVDVIAGEAVAGVISPVGDPTPIT